MERPDPAPDTAGLSARLSARLRAVMEGVVVLLVVLLPWGFGGVPAIFERVLFTGVAVLLALWAARMALEWRPIWAACPVTLCLAGLFLLGVWQVTPLPPPTLAAVSPGTASLNAKLLPEVPEVIVGEEPSEVSRPAAGSAISLYPAGTRALLLRLLAVAALFAAVRSNVASPESLSRLAVAALINGALLSLVGLLQFFSSPRDVVYWVFPAAPAEVFGPFNRNQFACCINLCIGLGVGLLLAGRASARRLRDDAAFPWVVAALALMLTALGLCLSRGGLLSLLGAAFVAAAVARCGGAGLSRFAAVALAGALALGLAAWFGLDETQGRLSALWKSDGVEPERWRVWTQTLPWARTFPVWGAGYGTFAYLEQMTRPPGPGPDFFYDHAHNNYLELLLEGGAVGLALGLAALVLVWTLAVRAYWRNRQRPAGALALGGLIAVTALALHSGVDFGLHIPAVAVLAAVLGAQLAALGGGPTQRPTRSWGFVVRTAGVLLGAAGAVAVAGVLTTEGRAMERADRLRRAAANLDPADEAARRRRLDYLRSAAALTPEDAGSELALADAEYEQRASGERLRAALSHYRKARDLCPLLERAHVGLAGHAGAEVRGEPASVHLGRARLLVPYNSRVWLLCGAQELKEGASERAWRSWRQALECSDEPLDEILTRSRERLADAAVVEKILPDSPELLYRAALWAEQREGDARPYLERAAELLSARPGEAADALLLEARVRARLDQPEKALALFDRLAAGLPRRSDWRLEYAQLLFDHGRLEDARRELRGLPRGQPDSRPAEELYRAVLRRLAEGR